jgi:hypothetical protein
MHPVRTVVKRALMSPSHGHASTMFLVVGSKCGVRVASNDIMFVPASWKLAIIPKGRGRIQAHWQHGDHISFLRFLRKENGLTTNVKYRWFQSYKSFSVSIWTIHYKCQIFTAEFPSYSESPGFKSPSRDHAVWIMFLRLTPAAPYFS